MTRNTAGRRAKELAELPGVELFEGSFANEDDLKNGFKDCDGAVSRGLFQLLFYRTVLDIWVNCMS